MRDLVAIHHMVNFLRGSYKVLEEDWRQAAAKLGLTQAEQHTIWIIYLEEETTISRLSEIGLWDISTVMQVIKRLKDKELVETRKRPNDRRVSYVSLTKAGRQKYEESVKETNRQNYQICQFFHDYEPHFSDREAFEKELIRFFKHMNQHFYGDDFVTWIDDSSRSFS